MPRVSVHWFRGALRLHDNQAIIDALADADKFYAVYVTDPETLGEMGYNRVQYLSECLSDLDTQLRAVGGQLYVLKGDPSHVFSILHKEAGMSKLTFEKDCEASWNTRDKKLEDLCHELGVEVEMSSPNSLWDPRKIIEANAGEAPLTYEMFLQVSSTLGLPPRPSRQPDWDDVLFGELSDELAEKLGVFPEVPTPEDLGMCRDFKESPACMGGEIAALGLLQERLQVEENAFRDGYILPNQVDPDLLGPILSMSPAISLGCLSVRKFYWEVQDVYFKLHNGIPAPLHSLTAQLVWREFFYTMAAHIPNFDQVSGNVACANIPWKSNNEHRQAWEEGRTGYPFIDAVMRQLKKEGWIHHICRTVVASFLTQGDLWISWEEGHKVFMKYLIDADRAVCAGNWLWLSSSAFERQLDFTGCVCPVSYGKKLDPTGEYIRRYVPELALMPTEYVHEPWLASDEVQEAANCIMTYHYPERLVLHEESMNYNKELMSRIRDSICCSAQRTKPSDTGNLWFLGVPQSVC